MKFGKTSADAPNDIRGFLGEGTEISGEVKFTEILRVDGLISGKITSESGALLVGEHGRIKATVEAGSISISGTVEGTIKAKSKVEIHQTGRVYGDIYAPVLIIEQGAIFDGKCHMAEREAATDSRNLKVVDGSFYQEGGSTA
jgi:cytoskeletal protein CcmA (bactofilin family)